MCTRGIKLMMVWLVPLTVATAACGAPGGSTASKSAAAYDQNPGLAAGGHEHGGHTAPPNAASSPATPAGHGHHGSLSARPASQGHGNHADVDHGTARSDAPRMPSQPTEAHGHAGMHAGHAAPAPDGSAAHASQVAHSATQPVPSVGHAGHAAATAPRSSDRPGTTDPHASHAASPSRRTGGEQPRTGGASTGHTPTGAVAQTPETPALRPGGHAGHADHGSQPPSQDMRERPAAVLQPDAFDAPAVTSVEDAARAAAMSEQMAGGHHRSHGSYTHVDAGRVPATSPVQRQSSAPPPTPSQSGHAGHDETPAVRPDQKQAPRTSPAVAPADSHHMHHSPAAKPSPSPSPTPRPSPKPKEKQQ
jgi:hypothetical protein